MRKRAELKGVDKNLDTQLVDVILVQQKLLLRQRGICGYE
jgi:hypothetical protein